MLRNEILLAASTYILFDMHEFCSLYIYIYIYIDVSACDTMNKKLYNE